MREFTEIKIVQSDYNNSEILEISELLFFKFQEKSLRLLVGGKPIKIDNNNIIFETQGFHEGLPKSKANFGTTVELFKDWKKTEKIGDGIIQSKYFKKAKRADWKLKEELSEENSRSLNFDMTFTQEEKEILEMGSIPLQMEDKWFIFQEENRLRFFRSWTGIEFYQAEFQRKNETEWHLSQLRIRLDNNLINQGEEIITFEMLLKGYLTSRKRILR